MHTSLVLSLAGLLSVCVSGLAAPAAGVKTVTTTKSIIRTSSITSTATTTATKTVTKRVRKTTTTTVSATPSPSCFAALAYSPGTLSVSPNGSSNNAFIHFCNGATAVTQDDGNFVIYPGNDNSGDGYTPFTNGYPCDEENCRAEFTADGNFQIVNYGNVAFSTNTGGMNAQRLVLSSGQPYLTIYDISGHEIYSSGIAEEARKSSPLHLVHKEN